VSDAADDRVDSAFAALAELYRRAAPGSELRHEIDSWAETALAAARTVAERSGEPLDRDVSEVELESAFATAEPEIAQMITPDSIAEEAALLADHAPDDRSPLASSGAFATRTMAELLEQQGDRRGAARIRAALGEPEAPDAPVPDNAAAITALERWLENVRRLRP
jgi:hypothetical protein